MQPSGFPSRITTAPDSGGGATTMRRAILSTLAALLTFAMFSGGAGGAAPAAAQEPGRIEGRITRQDGTPLPGVAVRVDQLDQVAITDSEGRFTFVPVPPGTY